MNCAAGDGDKQHVPGANRGKEEIAALKDENASQKGTARAETDSTLKWLCLSRLDVAVAAGPIWNFFFTCAAGLGDAQATLRRCENLTELDRVCVYHCSTITTRSLAHALLTRWIEPASCLSRHRRLP
jgi:hypothetical protein